jgi:hypothetical protein
VSSIAELLPVPEGSEAQGCFICQKWLDTWVNSPAEPDPVDNSVLLCQHHKLNPLLPAGTLKFISDTAWQEITVRHRRKGGEGQGRANSLHSMTGTGHFSCVVAEAGSLKLV